MVRLAGSTDWTTPWIVVPSGGGVCAAAGIASAVDATIAPAMNSWRTCFTFVTPFVGLARPRHLLLHRQCRRAAECTVASAQATARFDVAAVDRRDDALVAGFRARVA